MTPKSIVIGRGDPDFLARIEAERERRGLATASKTVRALVDERLAQIQQTAPAQEPVTDETGIEMPW